MYKLLNSNKTEITEEDYQKLVAVGLLTDGSFRPKHCRNTQIIEFYSNDSVLHSTFQKFMKLGFRRYKTSYYHYSKNKRVTITGYELSQKDKIVKTLKELSTTFITKRNSEPQPTIRFLFSQRRELKELAVKFAMSCDGCMSVAHTKSGRIIPSLKFACAHPTLAKEWKNLFNDTGIMTSFDSDKINWSGIHGIKSSRKESILKFQKIGGFYPKLVKVQGGNYRGLYKNQVLNGVCKWFENKEEDIDSLIKRNFP